MSLCSGLLGPDEGPNDDDRIDMETPLLIEQAEEKRAAEEKEAEEKAEAEKNRDPSMLSNKESNYNDDEEKEVLPGDMPYNPVKERLSNTLFHAVMSMGSCYMAMLMTSWGTGATLSTTGETSMYVNIVCQYITALMFWWSLCAPACFPDRFGDGNEDDD